MVTAIVLFAIGALFGLHILTHILKDKPTPKASVAFHGLLVVIGLIMVIIEAMNGAGGALTVSLIFFVLAALGGLTMVYFDLGKNQLPPKALALGHPVLAVIGLVALIVYAMR